MGRSRLSIGAKLRVIDEATIRRSRGESLRSVAARFGLQATQLKNWMAKKEVFKVATKAKKGLGRGRASSINYMAQELVDYVDEQRSAHLPVTYVSVMKYAGDLDADFKNLEYWKKYYKIRNLMRKHGVVMRVTTHEAQKDPDRDSVVELAQTWMLYIQPVVKAPTSHRKFIINMDETPVPYSFALKRTLSRRGQHSIGMRRSDESSTRATAALPYSFALKRTLSRRGQRSIGMRRSDESSTRATAALATCSDGSKLKPFVIFKAEPGGRIEKTELPTYPNKDKIVYNVQSKAWMDTSLMKRWIETVLVPHLQECAPNTTPILILDTLKAHTAPEVTDLLDDLGVSWHVIPGGCTSLVQPLDVGVNKPFKDRCKKLWWEWIENGGIGRSIFNKPKRLDIGTWIEKAWDDLPADIIRNSWRQTDWDYFEE